jgi:D-alanyl-D-alanine carboxypeptidase
MKKIISYLLISALTHLAFETPAAASPTNSVPKAVAESLLLIIRDHQAATPEIAGEALSVFTPEWKWSGAVGTVAGTQRPLTPAHAFRIASVTKSFTAAAILRLMETGKLDITQPITGYISKESAALLTAGGYDPSKITIQQLLSHTSGIYDYAMDEKFSAKVFGDPMHQWTRAEQIKHAMDNGKPLSKPGEIYAYSDTGYILLGEIIERKTEQNLATAVRSLLRFQKLGLTDTYWEQLERKPKSSKAPFTGNMFGPTDLTRANHSFDLFGGGGMISTTQDLAIFFRALIRGEVFDNRRTLAVLLTIPPAKRGEGGYDTYGNGVHQFKLGGEHCMGHGGFWGQAVAYCPASDITFAWSINHGGEKGDKVDFLDRLAAVIDK